jgi:D-proline reductase (dithiol) PrdB
VCHQSVGLIARHLEARGIATVTLSSAWSITASANPPRTAFLNYPLGHTAGRAHNLVEQTSVVSAALRLVATATEPGEIVPLPVVWPSPWKQKSRGLGDKRSVRHNTPQWQTPDDELAATSP